MRRGVGARSLFELICELSSESQNACNKNGIASIEAQPNDVNEQQHWQQFVSPIGAHKFRWIQCLAIFVDEKWPPSVH